MKTLNKIILVTTLSIWSLTNYAQQNPMYTHYMYNTLSINPAYAGSRDALTVTALHRSQWVGYKDAPLTQTLTLHTPINNKHIGLGLSVTNDKIGPTNNTTLVADFAYRMQISEKSKLAFGLSAGANIFQADLNSVGLDVDVDPSFQNNIDNRITPNFGFGAYYSRERMYVGISTPNLVQSTYTETGSDLLGKEERHYFFIAGTVLKLTYAAPVQADFTASFIIMQRLLLGAMVRTGDAVGVLVGFDITNQLHFGYSYDWSYGLKTSTYNQGSHELVLRYDFIFSSKKQIHSPRYF